MSNCQPEGYDPITNWNIHHESATATMPDHSGRAIRLSNIDDLLTEQDHRNIKLCLETQKVREDQLNTENPRFVNNLKYSLKPEFNSFRVEGETTITNKCLKTVHEVPVSEVPVINVFPLPSSKNVWRIKDRDVKNRSYILYNKNLCTYIKAPYEAITAFPDEENGQYELTNAALITENCTFRQQLFQRELEVEDLQLQLEQLKLERKTTGAASNDYWRRQYLISNRLKCQGEDNTVKLARSYATTNLELSAKARKAEQQIAVLEKKNRQLEQKLEEAKNKSKKLKRKMAQSEN